MAIIICSKCHLVLPPIAYKVIVNGIKKYVCENCYYKKENKFQCNHCKKEFDTNKMSDIDNVCKKCYLKYYFKNCSICNKMFYADDEYLNAIENEDTLICDNCLKKNGVYKKCVFCNDIYNKKDMYYYEPEDFWCCEYCYKNEFDHSYNYEE